MRVIVPRVVSLLSSNVPEAEHNEWLVGQAYTHETVYVSKAADGVTEITPHLIFTAKGTPTTGDYPPDNPSQWSLIKATNQGAMFDSIRGTPTAYLDNIQVTISASKADRVALFGVVGETVRIVARSGVTVISDETRSLRLDNQSSSWTDYLYNDIEYRTDFISVIPGFYANLELDITITAASGELAQCGHCVVGRSVFLGLTEWGGKTGITDFSIKEDLGFGEFYLNQRAYSKPLEVDLLIKTGDGGKEQARVERVLAQLRSVPCVWDANNLVEDGGLGTTERESFLVFGFCRDFGVTVAYASESHLSLEIEGLI